jgi:hypothetical protein
MNNNRSLLVMSSHNISLQHSDSKKHEADKLLQASLDHVTQKLTQSYLRSQDQKQELARRAARSVERVFFLKEKRASTSQSKNVQDDEWTRWVLKSKKEADRVTKA